MLLNTTYKWFVVCGVWILKTGNAYGADEKKPDLKEDDVQSRIIEGVNVHLELFEFVVSILHKGKHVCGGSIISHFFVLTAGHCCFSRSKERLPENLMISAGNKYYTDGTKYQVIRKYLHPEYVRSVNINDISLLRLRDMLEFKKGISWVKLHPLPVLDDQFNITATVIGWGYTNKDRLLVPKASMVLESVQIYSVPLEICKRSYKNLQESNICMTGFKMKGSCTGDSGGPLVITESNKIMQIGLVSYGSSCNNTSPEVYTRISSYYQWIKDTMKQSNLEFANVTNANKDIENLY